jgi:hypothetical protein
LSPPRVCGSPECHSCCCTFYGFWQMHKTQTHHWNTIWSSFTALKASVLHLVIPSLLQPLATTNYFLSPQFCLFLDIIESQGVWTFQIRFFHLVLRIQGSSVSFHDLMAHFFVLKIRSHCLDGLQFIYPVSYWRTFWLFPSFGNDE